MQDVILINFSSEDDADDNKDKAHVHALVTSISVLRTYRRLGIATKLMHAAEESLKEVYDAAYLSLNVRVTNRAAVTMYKDVFNFK